MSCEGRATAHTCAGRVFLHSCFQTGLWSASVESTGEGDTPALFVVSGVDVNEETAIMSSSIDDIGKRELEEFVASNPEIFINMLKKSDEVAWRKVRDVVIVPYLRKSRFGKMASDKNVDDDEVFTSVYVQLIFNGQLDRLRNKRRVLDCIKEYARKYVRSHYQVFRKKIVEQLLEEDDWSRVTEERTANARSQVNDEEQKGKIADAIGRLWKINPRYAYVLVMKTKNQLSSKNVMDAIGVSSELNVNKMYQRAKSAVRKELETGW